MFVHACIHVCVLVIEKDIKTETERPRDRHRRRGRLTVTPWGHSRYLYSKRNDLEYETDWNLYLYLFNTETEVNCVQPKQRGSHFGGLLCGNWVPILWWFDSSFYSFGKSLLSDSSVTVFLLDNEDPEWIKHSRGERRELTRQLIRCSVTCARMSWCFESSERRHKFWTVVKIWWRSVYPSVSRKQTWTESKGWKL